jgi:hypothetical protein
MPAILLLLFAGTSCNKGFLERSPKDTYDNAFLWKTTADATAALNGCYHNWESGENVIYNDCFTDNGYDQYSWEGYESVAQGNVTPLSLGAANRWNYGTIQKCNWFLENIVKAPIDESIKKRMSAEARFLRAYQYFVLSQLYGDVPLVTKQVKLDSANLIPQTPKSEVVKFILDELSAIAPDLPPSYSGTDIGRITRGATLALAARTRLFNQDYDGCVAACEQLMAAPFSYDLYPSFTDLFRPLAANNKEVILDVQYMKTYNSFGSLGSLRGAISITQSLVDAYEMLNGKTIDDPTSGYNPLQPFINRDPRLDATVLRPGLKWEGIYFDPLSKSSTYYYLGGNWSPTCYAVNKFLSHLSTDFDDISNVGLNFIVIRYAEVLLTYAEAKIELGKIDASVYDAIDKVRERAGMPAVDRTVYNTQASLRKLIRRERRVEFAMEGLRWYDIQRWKIGPEVMTGSVMGSLKGSVNPQNGELTLIPDSRILVSSPRKFDAGKNYLWPIPQKEVDLNKKLKQNLGY